ncbi:MAG: hypothetical protein PWQ24_1285 [Mesotoga sp.]|nr:hypothetical protein [Mesotoga sp.]
MPNDKQITIDEIVPASLSFEKSLAILQEGNRWRFVLGEDSKLGIVTAADFQKIPVRVVLFREISQLEVSLNNTFDSWKVDDALLGSFMGGSPLQRAKDYREKAKKANIDQRLGFYLNIKEKLDLLRGILSSNDMDENIVDVDLLISEHRAKQVKDLRDCVAHSKLIEFEKVPSILREMRELREKLVKICNQNGD